ncbi:MAG: AAA family ATPase, partial [Pseudomonadota bacterium]|nr:AAA family ATPase [Pseudomonadota bacterium]
GQTALFARVRRFLADVADQQPLVLILDDLHWADPASLDLLRFMARELGTLRVLLLVTYRADDVTRDHPLYALIPRLVREARAERLDLKGLSDDETRALVQANYRLSEADERRLAAYLQQRTDGNPFYIGEVLRALEEEGVLQRGSACVLGDLERAGIPPLLRQVIDARLARLRAPDGVRARQLLEVAAVIGQELPLALWESLVGVADEALIEVVDSAVDARILVALPNGTGVRFVHALIREALYAGILPPRRRVWHLRIAEALMAAPRPDPDVVAYHLQRAGDTRAGPWLVRAGERAQRTYAWLTAADRYEAALRHLDPVDAAVERGWLLCDLAWLRHFVDPEGSMAYLDEASRLARTLQDDALGAFAAFGRGFLHCRAGAIRRGLAEMTDAWAALELLPRERRARPKEVSDRGLLTEITAGSALAHWLAHVGRYTEAQTLAERLLRQAPAMGPGLAPFAEALYTLAHVAAAAGRPREATAYYRQAAEAFRTIDHYVYVGGATIDIVRFVVLPYATDDLPERRRLMADSEAAMAKTGGVYPQFGPRNAYLPSALLEGRWDEAAELTAETRAGSPGSILRSVRIPIRGWLARERGDVAAAWTAVREIHRDGPASVPGGYFFLAALSLQWLAAMLALDARDLTAARDWIAAHDRWLAWSGALLGRAEGLLLWAAYLRELGDSRTAGDLATEALQ